MNSLLLDLFSAPNLIYPGYPGIVYVVATGNSGPAYGGVARPGAASMAITVGASSSYHFIDNPGKNDVAWFSNRGPTPYGTIKPDVVSPGNTGFTHYQVITGLGNGSLAGGRFGGTSEATPRASGAIALVMEAMKSIGITPTLSNIRTVVKGTATDIGYHPAAQGAGLINAHEAVRSILHPDRPLIRTNASSILLGNRLQPAFGNLFVDDNDVPLLHPMVSGNYYDSFIIVTPETLAEGINIELVFGNGTLVTNTQYAGSVEHLIQTSNGSFSFAAENEVSTVINLEEIWELSSNWKLNDLIQISLSLTEESYNALSSAGLDTPNLKLSDSDTGKLIYDLGSINTWIQQLYSGNPSSDFDGSPTIEFEDPGIINEVSQWPGLNYEGFVQTYNYSAMPGFDISINNSWISIKSESVANEFQFASFIFEDLVGGNKFNYPILISSEEEVKFGDSASIVGDQLEDTVPYDLDTYFGSFDWGYRPDSGEFRHFRLKLPKNATFLAISGKWDVDGFIPDMYLFNDYGELVTQTNVQYAGGGFYDSKVSEPFSQNLFTEVETQVYTLLVHVVHMPFSAKPVEFSLLTRYLAIDTLPLPQPDYSQDLSDEISGDLFIDTSNYEINGFPELNITSTDIQIYQGRNGSLEDSMPISFLVPGPADNLGMIEAIHFLEFEKGEKVYLRLNWSDDLDLDMFIFKQNEVFDLKSDLLSQQGSSAGNSFEEAHLAIPETGTYVIYIDFVVGELSSNNIRYHLSWDSRDGPTINQQTDNLKLQTRIFPNDIYGAFITFNTNFGISFTISAQITMKNHFNFTSNLISPSEGKVNSIITVIWEANTIVLADISLIIGSTEIQLGNGITSSSFNFNSNLYPNGDAILQVILTDKIYIHSYTIAINIDNSNPVTLEPETKTSSKSVNYSSIVLMLIVLIIEFIAQLEFIRISA
jgi:hypothetical protein